jgi:hypothetical protein
MFGVALPLRGTAADAEGDMRKRAPVAVVILSALISMALAHAALAAPSTALVWTNCVGATCGAGVGTSSIVAGAGDTLTLDIVLTPDANGISAAALTLGYDSNQLFGLSAEACPTGDCDPWISPVPIPIDNVGPGSTMGPFVAQWSPATLAPSIVIGRATFSVQAPGTVSLVYGLDEGVWDGFGVIFYPSASADAVPEPSTAALLALGLCGLAAVRAQRRSARARSR